MTRVQISQGVRWSFGMGCSFVWFISFSLLSDSTVGRLPLPHLFSDIPPPRRLDPQVRFPRVRGQVVGAAVRAPVDSALLARRVAAVVVVAPLQCRLGGFLAGESHFGAHLSASGSEPFTATLQLFPGCNSHASISYSISHSSRQPPPGRNGPGGCCLLEPAATRI